MDDLMSLYIEDMKEYLGILHDSIFSFERSPNDVSAISEMFRAFHTMKSSTAAMEFKKAAGFIHRMEDLLHEIREGKILINLKIIKLFYKTYDLLYKFLENVIKSGSEGDCDYSDVLATAGSIISENSKDVKTGADNASEIPGRETRFILNEADVNKLKEAVWRGNQAYIFTAVIEENCVFRSVRTWMILEELEKLSAIICSDPVKPDSEDFINGRFDFNGSQIRAVIVLETSADEVLQELKVSATEIEKIELTAIRPDFEQGMDFDTLQIASNTGTDSDLSDEYVSGVIDRIIGKSPECREQDSEMPFDSTLTSMKDQIKVCEIDLLNLGADICKPDDISKISAILCSVKKESEIIGHELLSDLAQRAIALCDIYAGNISPDNEIISRLADVLTFMKKLCEDISLAMNEEFLKEMEAIIEEAPSAVKESGPDTDKIGDILVQSGLICNEDIGEIVKKQKESYPDLKFGQIAVKENKADLKDIIHALHVQDTRTEQKSQAYIRIPANKVDNLVDLLGELIITQSLHKQNISEAFNKENNKLVNNIIRMERIAKDIQDITMSLRMVSLKQTFQKIYRIGRDTAMEMGKSVEIVIMGEDTEIDRNIVEKIHDPMMHIIRNAISHGLEADRPGAGKPLTGNILIQAYNRKGNVYIEMSDDGKGMNLDKIYNKAVEKGLADPSGKYTEDEILRFIYLPGFSTEENVNNISGRGVGMNVVQAEIAKLGGKIEIVNKPGIGCTFILKIPVNLATINGTIVEISENKYIIPTLNIKQILKPEAEQWIFIKGRQSMVLIRDDILQVIPVNRILDPDFVGEENESGLIMVVEHEQKLMALPVKAIQGKQEVVVKSISSDFRNLNFVSGATILGDGKVALILDIDSLFKMTGDPCYTTVNKAV